MQIKKVYILILTLGKRIKLYALVFPITVIVVFCKNKVKISFWK